MYFTNCKSSIELEQFADDISKSEGTILHSNAEYEFTCCSFIVEADDKEKFRDKFRSTDSYKSEI